MGMQQPRNGPQRLQSNNAEKERSVPPRGEALSFGAAGSIRWNAKIRLALILN